MTNQVKRRAESDTSEVKTQLDTLTHVGELKDRKIRAGLLCACASSLPVFLGELARVANLTGGVGRLGKERRKFKAHGVAAGVRSLD